MKVLDKADLSQFEPTSYANQQDTHQREDTIQNLETDLSKNAPEWEENCYRVPKMG